MEETRDPASNVIPMRIAEMLRNYPPFSMFSEEEVLNLSRRAQVKAMAKGETLWKQGDMPGAWVYFLSRGRVEYYWSNEGRVELVDVRDVGDTLGLTPLLEKETFRVTGYVAEDVLAYLIDGEALQHCLEGNDAARYYVRRHLFWATRVGGPIAYPGEGTRLRHQGILHTHFDGAQSIRPRPLNRLLSCSPGESLRDAAVRMTEKNLPSIVVVDEQRRPLGILTSSDLVRAGLVEERALETRVEDVMIQPVKTVESGSSAMGAMLFMLRERIGQVCVTEDGTPDTPVLDVCSHKDLLAQSGHHPAGLVREIRAARSNARLRELCDELEQLAEGYLESGLSAIFVAQVFAELQDELVIRLVDMAKEDLESWDWALPDVEWAWMAVGSDGRREQILRTDMDNALVFRSTGDNQQDEENRRLFLRLTERVVEGLVGCGFSRCQGGIMASNPRWCRTEVEWLDEFNEDLIHSEDRMLRLITLYDLRAVAGKQELAETLRKRLFELFQNSPHIQNQLAEVMVETPPPLNFWGNFVVEKKGSAEGHFDIKARGMNPVRDAARLLALKYNILGVYSTGGRLNELMKAVPSMSETATLARQSYDFMFRLRSLTGLRNGDSGRYIEPRSLTKMQRASLSNAFDVQRMLQFAVKREFNLEWRRG